MAGRYDPVYDGEAVKVRYKESPLLWACCDCGLVHHFEYYLDGDELMIYNWRDSRATAAIRRHKKANLFNGADSLWKIVRRRGRGARRKSIR